MTEGGDVFDFGVLLVELICGRPVVDKTKVGVEQDLVRWVKLHSLNTFLDNMLGGDYPCRAAGIAANLALRCLSLNPDERPLMAQVLFELEHLKLNADEYMIWNYENEENYSHTQNVVWGKSNEEGRGRRGRVGLDDGVGR